MADTEIRDVRYLFVINPDDASFPHETTNAKGASGVSGYVSGPVYAYDIYKDEYIGQLFVEVSNEESLTEGNYIGLNSNDDAVAAMSIDELSHDLAEKIKHSIFNQLKVAV